MNITNRVILLISGLGLAWCAVWGASEMRAWAMSAQTTHPWGIVCIIGLVALIIGVCGLYFFAADLKNANFHSDGLSIHNATVHLVCFAFLFGIIVGPAKSGMGIETWATPWLFLLILGFLPMAFVVVDIIVDATSSQRPEGVQANDAQVRAFTRRA
ncbi:MAG: hypothetical protein WC217_01355 [Candidatus Paceibacterota bacterium]|jgi:hypothetical protein